MADCLIQKGAAPGWVTADMVPVNELTDYLCTMAQYTQGDACGKCPVGCAFGEKWLSVGAPWPKKREQHKQARFQVWRGDEMIGEWKNSKAAARGMGLRYESVRTCNARGLKLKGYWFRWQEVDL